MLHEVISSAKAFMTKELGLEGRVISLDRKGEEWVTTAEATLVDPEMRRVAKKDLVATYELRLNNQYEVQSFMRKAMRERGSIAP